MMPEAEWWDDDSDFQTVIQGVCNEIDEIFQNNLKHFDLSPF